MNSKALFLLLIISTNVGLCIDYQTQIQPIFSQYCTGCHPNSGGLNLSSYNEVIEGGNSGMVVAVYNHTASILYDRITREESDAGDMPPAGSLNQSQINLIGQWIYEGALPYEVDYSDMDYDTDINSIFEQSCSNMYCHGGDAGGLNILTYDALMEGGSHGDVIIPGNGPESNLIRKLSAAPPFGNQMPNNMPPLHPLNIAKINTWINEGANPSGASEMDIVVVHNSDWNMVGLPLTVEDPSQNSIFPESIENTLYIFDGGYVQAQELVNGNGCWLRFEDEGTTIVSGFPFDYLTINLDEGWNMISGIYIPVSIDYGINDPDNIIVEGTLYGFNNGYVSSTSLYPGMGYWVRTNSAGQIIVSTEERDETLFSAGANMKLNNTNLLESVNKISINGLSLLFGGDLATDELIKYSLPPKPPLGAFDVRFSDDMRWSENGGVIDVQSSLDLMEVEIRIKDDSNWNLKNSHTGDEFNLMNNHYFTLPSVNELKLTKDKGVSFPEHFYLKQNFPNPFNPSTIITFDVLKDEHIYLSIFSVQGQLINNLVDEIYIAGQYSAIWDGRNTKSSPVPSGIYFYKLETVDKFISKKMILLR